MIWTDKDSENLKAFLDSSSGDKFLKTLHLQRPSPQCDAQEHQASYRLGGVAGFELAEAAILKLSVVKPTPKKAPEANYGVPDKATPA